MNDGYGFDRREHLTFVTGYKNLWHLGAPCDPNIGTGIQRNGELFNFVAVIEPQAPDYDESALSIVDGPLTTAELAEVMQFIKEEEEAQKVFNNAEIPF